MKKSLYICGDSFCTIDPEYGTSWVTLLERSLLSINVINLASPGASNYLINLQVQHALDNNCDYLIYHATSSIRNEFSLESTYSNNTNSHATIDNLDRYWSPHSQNNKSVVSNSWISPTRSTDKLLTSTSTDIKKFFTHFVDFPSTIRKNYIFIDYTLGKISRQLPSNNWAWSRGGFEHKNFNSIANWDFSLFLDHECPINLWDNYDNNLLRPYYHVTDLEIHQKVCNYYINKLNLANV